MATDFLKAFLFEVFFFWGGCVYVCVREREIGSYVVQTDLRLTL